MNIEVLPFGESAVLINFEQKIDFATHQMVMGVCNNLEAASIEGITFIAPAYCSITMGYAPQKIKYQQLKSSLRNLLEQPVSTKSLSRRLINLPVCYEEPYALDLTEISEFSGLNRKEVVALHTSQTYQVYMLGFLPGFPYLGILPELLHFPRKDSPRFKVPERSVGIANAQTGIYPSESPGGWHIIGSTPLPIFDTSRNELFLFKAGDEVKFYPIGLQEYDSVQTEILDGCYNWEAIYGNLA